MPVWLEKPLLLAIHARQLAEHGGVPGVRDEDLLESALAQPRQPPAAGEPPPDLADQAAALAFALVRDQPFNDGNKRTAFVACRTFLALNRAEVVSAPDAKYLALIALADGEMTREDFAEWLRASLSDTARGAAPERRRRHVVRRRPATRRVPAKPPPP